MKTFSQVPIYNLKVVINETGIKADALRVWERRYGLPAPTRTAGGQRLYSRYDIEMIRWLMSRQLEGWRISQVVVQWQKMISGGVDPLGETAEGTLQPTPIPVVSSSMLDELRVQWIQACLAFDELGAETVLNQAFAVHPLETVCAQVLLAGLREMGERWYNGQDSVQQEHFASALVGRRLEALIAASPRPLRMQTVLVACTPGEWHTLPLLMLSLHMRRRGLNVVYLGANTPSRHLVETVRMLHPALVVLVAQQLVSAAALRRIALDLQVEQVQTAYGGWIFNQIPELCGRIPAHFLGVDIEQAAGQADQLCSTPRPVPQAGPYVPQLQAAAGVFRRHRALIEHDLFEMVSDQGIESAFLVQANDYLGNGLLAALELGDLAYLAVDMNWVGNMLAFNPPTDGLLRPYMAAYCQAVDRHLGVQGQVITGWIQQWLQTTAGTQPVDRQF